MKVNVGENSQVVKILVVRAQGNLFYAGPKAGSGRAKAEADDLGTPIRGRDGVYPLVGSFVAGSQVRYANGVTLDVSGATATIAISEDELEALNGLPGNAWVLSFQAHASAPNTQNPGSRIHGSVWLEVLNEPSADRADALVTDADLAQAAVAQNAAASAERREQRRAMAALGRGESAPPVQA